MLNFKIGYFPSHVAPLFPELISKEEREEDGTAPFFSEAYLYELLGKEEARVVLYYIRELCEECGIKEP